VRSKHVVSRRCERQGGASSEHSGAADVIAWFGEWPSFHDAEISELHLHRRLPSRLRVHYWRVTSALDKRQHFVCDKHATVTFELEDILNLELADFSHQNVIFALHIEPASAGVRLILSPCYGLAGWIEARGIRVSLEPHGIAFS